MKVSHDLERKLLALPGVTVGRSVSLPVKTVAAVGKVVKDSRGMNKTEAAYAALLDVQKEAGEVAAWFFESVKVRLADRTWYSPDFMVILTTGAVEFHEVKGGFVRDDALVKFKVAREMFKAFAWRMFIGKRGRFTEREF